MKCQIHVNRSIVANNKKADLDNPALSIKCSLGTIHVKKIEFLNGAKLFQDASRPRSCGATVWLETNLNNIIADGVQLDRNSFLAKNSNRVDILILFNSKELISYVDKLCRSN